jgi:hypothetical protein
MTAEIVIMNKEAAVLAADSAVTLQRAYLTKVSVSANKIFQMCANSPVGIMLFGNALFMGLPWETVIKSYRVSRAGKRFDSVKQYGKDFIEYLRNNKLEFDVEGEERYLEAFVESVFKEIGKGIDDLIQKLIVDQDVGLTKTALKSIVKIVINAHYKECRKKYHEIIPMGLCRRVVNKYLADIERVMTLMFEEKGLPKVLNVGVLNRGDRRKLKEILINELSKYMREDILSGIVIVGFGEKEYTPRKKVLAVEGKINGELKFREEPVGTVRGSSDANIHAFAQNDITVRFMTGVDKLYRAYEDDYIRGLCIDYAEKVVNSVAGYSNQQKRGLKRQLVKYGRGVRKEFNEKMEEFMDMQFVQPILQTVASLPKVELATVAEALVHLTSMKKKVSLEEESVGGPIDVAVISKHDGFIWIKRKHYFESAFNPQFFVRYGKENRND